MITQAWVGFADTHDYDRMSQWLVAVYHNEADAHEHARQAQQIANRWGAVGKKKLTEAQRQLGRCLDLRMEAEVLNNYINYSVEETPLMTAIPTIEGVTI